jgi:hypothetical protein
VAAQDFLGMGVCAMLAHESEDGGQVARARLARADAGP